MGIGNNWAKEQCRKEYSIKRFVSSWHSSLSLSPILKLVVFYNSNQFIKQWTLDLLCRSVLLIITLTAGAGQLGV